MTTQPPDITDQIITDDHDIPNIEDIFNLDWTTLEHDGIDFANWIADIPSTFLTAQAKAVAGILHWTIWTEANVVDHQRRAGYVTEEELREQLEGAATKEDIGQAFIVETVDKLRSGEISLMLDAIWGTQRPDIRGLDPTC